MVWGRFFAAVIRCGLTSPLSRAGWSSRFLAVSGDGLAGLVLGGHLGHSLADEGEGLRRPGRRHVQIL